MIVNESGLLKAMRDSYKGSGYHVAFGEVFERWHYLIASYGYSWGVVIRSDKMPRKVLGLLVEHIGKLPEDGEAYLCRKDEDAQDEIFSVAAKPLLLKLGEARGKVLPSIRKTRLIWDGENVWQSAEMDDVVLMRPDYEDIAIFQNQNMRPKMVDGCLYVEGQQSYVMIHKSVPGEADRETVANLGRHLWI